MWGKKPDWVNCMSNHCKLSFHISTDESESFCLKNQFEISHYGFTSSEPAGDTRSFPLYFVWIKQWGIKLKSNGIWRCRRIEVECLGNDLCPFVLPLEKDAHIFEIVMPQPLALRLEACILSVCIFCLSRKGQHHFST